MIKDVMTLKDVAEYLQLSEASIRRMVKARTLPAFKVGQQWRFLRSILEEWMKDKINESQNDQKEILHK